jgi:hypothetical protein
MEGTLYIYFDSFEISIPLMELYKEGEIEDTEKNTYLRGLKRLEEKKVPYSLFEGFTEEIYEVLK